MKIFIVEDSALVRGRIIVMLSNMPGIRICGIAGTPEDAVRSINTLNPDVAVVDLKLYGGTGLDVIRNIRKENKQVVIIVLTNYAYPQYREKCVELGADYFFDKSVEFEKAIDTIVSLSEVHRVNV